MIDFQIELPPTNNELPHMAGAILYLQTHLQGGMGFWFIVCFGFHPGQAFNEKPVNR